MSTPNILCIGTTSQISHFMPPSVKKVSSRTISFLHEKNPRQHAWRSLSGENVWWPHECLPSDAPMLDRVIICTGDQSTWTDDVPLEHYDKVNNEQVVRFVNDLLPHAKTIVVFGTIGLWGQRDGIVLPGYEFSDPIHPYYQSKINMTLAVRKIAEQNPGRIAIVHPSNFNSRFRHPNTLFGEVFQAISERRPFVARGNLRPRDITHPIFVADFARTCEPGEWIVGTGEAMTPTWYIQMMLKEVGLDPRVYFRYGENAKENLHPPMEPLAYTRISSRREVEQMLCLDASRVHATLY